MLINLSKWSFTLDYRVIVHPLINAGKMFNSPASIPNPPFINFWLNDMIVSMILNERMKEPTNRVRQ